MRRAPGVTPEEISFYVTLRIAKKSILYELHLFLPTFCSAVTLLNGAAVALLRAAGSGATPERALDVISTCAGLSGHGADRTSDLCDYYYLQYFFLLSVVTVVLLTGTSGALLRAAPRGSAAGEGNEATREISCPLMAASYFPPRLALLTPDFMFHG